MDSEELRTALSRRSIFDTVGADDVLMVTMDSGENSEDVIMTDIKSNKFTVNKKNLIHPRFAVNFDIIVTHFVQSAFIKHTGNSILL